MSIPEAAPPRCNACGRETVAAGGETVPAGYYCVNKQCSRHGRTNDYLAEAAPPEDVCSRCGIRDSQHRLEAHDFLSTQYPEAAPPRATTLTHPICATWPVCIQCGIYVKPPADPWTVKIEDAVHGPLHKRCCNAFGRRTLAYPLAAHPATTPEPTMDEGFWEGSYNLLRDAVMEHLADCIRPDDVAEEAIMVDAIAGAGARLRASSPSRESGALPMAERQAHHALTTVLLMAERAEIVKPDSKAFLEAAIATVREHYLDRPRVSGVDQANLARLDAIREEMFTVGDENDQLRSRLSTLERDAARMREAERELRFAGGQLANVAFNLAQNRVLDERTRETLDACRKLWDSTTEKHVTASVQETSNANVP